MLIDNECKLDFSDVLIRPKRSTLESRSQVNLIRNFKTRHGYQFSGIPIIASNMATGTFPMLEVFADNGMFVAIAKLLNEGWEKMAKSVNGLDGLSNARKLVSHGFYTIGMSTVELEEMNNLVCSYPDVFRDWELKICIDIANGYTQNFAYFVKKVRDYFPNSLIVAGNVATPEMVQELVIAGADFIKIGIGPGSVCTTRQKTGVGYPQISASIECSDAAHGLNAGIVLDGGMRCPGDIAKAFVANADMVMIGGMLAGTDECDGDVKTYWYETDQVEVDDWLSGKTNRPKRKVIEKSLKLFYGMSSEYAQERHYGDKKGYIASEGITEEVECKGPVINVIADMLGGLRSAGTYIGAKTIKDFGKCGTLIRVSRQHDRF